MTGRPTVVAIVGATATGKSDLAVAIAAPLQGEILSIDSRLLYRGMDIGTAKPSAEQRQSVTHHLIDVAEPNETWSLARYQRAVAELIPGILGRGRVPLLVGGTGQYMRAILEGWSPPPRPADPRIRRRLQAAAAAGRTAQLVQRLKAVDPESARRIDPRNVRRVIRALEVYEQTGIPASRLRRRQEPEFRAVVVGLTLPRPDLFARIDARIDRMIADGLVEEVRSLLGAGFDRSLPAMTAIGYAEIAAHLAGEITLEEAIARMRRATRAFVRRQANWFRADDPSIRWFTVRSGVEAEVAAWLIGALRARGRRS